MNQILSYLIGVHLDRIINVHAFETVNQILSNSLGVPPRQNH